MKVLYIGMLRRVGEDTAGVELAAEHDVSSFGVFTKGSAREMLTFGAAHATCPTLKGKRIEIREPTYTIYTYGRIGDLVGVVVADTEYPKAVAERLLNVICEEFVSRYPLTTINDAKPNSLPYPELKNYLVKYQDPGSADSISKIQNELAETKTILYNTLEAAIGRGEKIDSLVAKSETLSAQSKMFYTQAKKQNSCCIVM